MPTPTDRESDSDAVVRFREPVEFHLRFALTRTITGIALIYLINVGFNAVDLVLKSSSFDGYGSTILNLFALRGPSTVRILPAVLGAVIGIVGLIALLALAPVRYRLGKRAYRKSLVRHREYRLSKRVEDDPTIEIDRIRDIERWADDVLASSELERQDRLQTIKTWLDHDRLLVERTAVEIAKHRLMQNVFLWVIGPVSAVIAVRVALLLT